MDIQELLKEATKDTLSEENLKTIEEAVIAKADQMSKDKYSLKLEAALAKQDGEYASKLEQFLEDIDNDHTSKMKTIIEGMNAKHCKMLQSVVAKYKNEYLSECTRFKNDLVKKVDKFFDIVVEEQIPVKELNEAVENTRSKQLIAEISKLIGVDKLQQNSLVREGLLDAKSQIDKLNEQVQQLQTERKSLLSEKVSSKRISLLAEKTQGLPKVKKVYIERVLGNKSIDFIKENFDYTLALFEEEDATASTVLREEAKQTSKTISHKIDRVQKQEVVKESVQAQPTDMYMEELSRI